MAASKKHIKRRRGQERPAKTQSNGRFLYIGVSVLMVALLGFGTYQVLGNNHNQAATSGSVVQAGSDSSETLSIADNQGAQALNTEPVTDRETRYLGPASDPATVALAEAGELGQPTLLWFHADWWHVCQAVKPEVVNLGEEYDGKVKIVRVNVDYSESSAVLRRYGVRATPTFVLFDETGELRGNVPGWPGRETLTNAFDTLLAGG